MPSHQYGPVTVLVVEDDMCVNLIAVGAIRDEGYMVLSARDADEALLTLDAHPEIDVLFTDIRMPGSIDGLALAHRTRREHSRIEIVIASGNLRPAPEQMPAGAMFLPKPYSPVQIGAVLRDLIDQTRPSVLASVLRDQPLPPAAQPNPLRSQHGDRQNR